MQTYKNLCKCMKIYTNIWICMHVHAYACKYKQIYRARKVNAEAGSFSPRSQSCLRKSFQIRIVCPIPGWGKLFFFGVIPGAGYQVPGTRYLVQGTR